MLSLGIGSVELLRFFNIASTAYFCFFLCHVSRVTLHKIMRPHPSNGDLHEQKWKILKNFSALEHAEYLCVKW